MESIPVLEKFLKDKELAIQQTCELAIEKIKLEQHSQPILQNVKPNQIQYGSVDPAPAFIEDYSVPELQKILVNESVSLFTRCKLFIM